MRGEEDWRELERCTLTKNGVYVMISNVDINVIYVYDDNVFWQSITVGSLQSSICVKWYSV